MVPAAYKSQSIQPDTFKLRCLHFCFSASIRCDSLDYTHLYAVPVLHASVRCDSLCYTLSDIVLVCITISIVQVSEISRDSMLANIHFFRVRDYTEQASRCQHVYTAVLMHPGTATPLLQI